MTKNALIPLALACIILLTVAGTSCVGISLVSHAENPALSVTTTSLLAGIAGTPYGPVTLAATGGAQPYVWSIMAGTLPAGVTITNGVIGGTPTSAGKSSFTVKVTDSSSPPLAATQALSISITTSGSTTVMINTTALPAGNTGIAYSSTLAVSGGTQPYSWSIISGALPTGLSLNQGSGAISGTPSSAGQSSFTVKVTDSSSPQKSATEALSISITASVTPLVIATGSLPAGDTGIAYSSTLAASGGTQPYSWSIISGALPAGLTLNASSGAISGTPTSAAQSSFTVKVTDSSSPQKSATQALSISITASVTPLVIATGSLPAGDTGIAYSSTLAASGGTKPYSWSIISGALPAGLTLNVSSGAISGTPTSAAQSSFTVKVTDSGSPQKSATQALSISITASATPPVIATGSLPAGDTGIAYSSTLTATGGTKPYSWSIISGALPTGLTLNISSGAISGKPTSAAQSSFTVKVTDSSSPQKSATQALSISITASTTPLAIATGSLPGGDTGVAYSSTLTASGGTKPYSWSIISGALPTGLSLNAGSGAISGTPASASQSSFTVKVTDSSSPQKSATQALSISITASGPSVEIYPGQNVCDIVSEYPAGTTFVINPGTYRQQCVINAKSGDVFLGPCATPPCAISSQAILNGSRLLTTFQYSGSYYYVTGQTQEGRVTIPSSDCVTGYPGCIYPEDLYFDSVPLQHVDSLSDVGPGMWFFDYSSQTIYFYDNPSEHTVETSVTPSAFEPGPANDVTIQGLTVEKFAAPVMTGAVAGAGTTLGSWTTGANWLVQNNEILLNHGDGVRINFGWQVLNNLIHDNGNIGIGGGLGGTKPNAILIQGNQIYNNNYARVLPAFGAAGIKILLTTGAVIRGNDVHDNYGTGIHLDTDNLNDLVDGNTVTNNRQGIMAEIGYAVTIRNNTLVGNGYVYPTGTNWLYGANVLSATSQNVEAYCNTVEISAQGGNGIDILTQPRGSHVSSGNYFHHNTVTFEGNSGWSGAGSGDPTGQPNFFSLNNFNYNTYHLPDLSAPSFAWSGGNHTFAKFQAMGPDADGSADTNYTVSAPAVVITSPADQSTVSGVVDITGTASDATSVSKVEFYVDWALQSTTSGDSFSFAWNTNTLQAGEHTVAAMAYNSEGIRSCFGVTLNVP
jgi:parallel beta-helix repeat protein